jgi:hypothetical protein
MILMQVKKRTFAPFMYKMFFLPRQARDKHRENSNKDRFVAARANLRPVARARNFRGDHLRHQQLSVPALLRTVVRGERERAPGHSAARPPAADRSSDRGGVPAGLPVLPLCPPDPGEKTPLFAPLMH